ncbi:MAG: HAD-IIA family hydrolase [Pseudolabrys sp.]
MRGRSNRLNAVDQGTRAAETGLPPPPGSDLSGNWISSAEAFLIDLDGTLIQDDQVMQGGAEMLDRLSGKFVIVSNNSTDTADILACRLHALGLPVVGRQLVLAGEQTIRFLAERHAGCRVILFADEMLRRMAMDCGLTLVDRNADLVVLMRDRSFDYAKLSLAANELRAGARLVVSNPDRTHPAPRGGIVVETGALMQAVTACSGVSPLRIVGKPEPDLFAEALRRLSAMPDTAMVIGDNLDTDARGAVRLGMRYLMIGSGADAASPRELLALPGRGHFAIPVQNEHEPLGRATIGDL